MPLFCFLFFYRVEYPQKGEDSPDFKSFSWSVYQHVDSTDSIYCQAAAALTSMLSFSYKTCMGVLRRGRPMTDDELMAEYPVGRLGFKEKGAGKVRVFAIPNALKQALPRPAYDWCMEVLNTIPMNGTFHLHKTSGAVKEDSQVI